MNGYLIEMQKAGTMAWIKCNTTPSLICEYTLTNMPQGEEFKFHVMACNAGGSGEPAEVPGTVTVTEMLGKATTATLTTSQQQNQFSLVLMLPLICVSLQNLLIMTWS